MKLEELPVSLIEKMLSEKNLQKNQASNDKAIRIKKKKGAKLSTQHFLTIEQKRRRISIPNTPQETQRSYTGRTEGVSLHVNNEENKSVSSIKRNGQSSENKFSVRQKSESFEYSSQNSSQENTSRKERKNNAAGLPNSINNKPFEELDKDKNDIYSPSFTLIGEKSSIPRAGIFFDIRKYQTSTELPTHKLHDGVNHIKTIEEKNPKNETKTTDTKTTDEKFLFRDTKIRKLKNQDEYQVEGSGFGKLSEEDSVNDIKSSQNDLIGFQKKIEENNENDSADNSKLVRNRSRIGVRNRLTSSVRDNNPKSILATTENDEANEGEPMHSLVAQIRNGVNPFEQRLQKKKSYSPLKKKTSHRKRGRLQNNELSDKGEQPTKTPSIPNQIVADSNESYKIIDKENRLNKYTGRKSNAKDTSRKNNLRGRSGTATKIFEKSPSFTFFYNETTRNTRPTPNFSPDDITILSEDEEPTDLSEYVDLAINHAEVTWSQDPFRASEVNVDRPVFDIDYTKDPNIDNEAGSAEKNAAVADFKIRVVN